MGSAFTGAAIRVQYRDQRKYRLNTGILKHGSRVDPARKPSEEKGIKAFTLTEMRLKRLAEAALLARIKLAQSFQKQQRHYNLRRRDWAPAVSEEVFTETHFLSKKSDGVNAKLCEKYVGPYNVHRMPSPVIFDLKDKNGKILRHIHIKDLKPSKAQPGV